MGLVVALCRLPPPSSSSLSVILILVVQRSRNPTNNGITASPLRSSPSPSPSRPLRPLDRPWRHL
jgi:hypothetical protein